MDYSILLHVVQMETTSSVKNGFRPLLWARSNGKTYALSYALIDLFMHEAERGKLNELGARITSPNRVGCSQDDIEPIEASLYRERFLLMFGERRKDSACAKSRPAFVYFPRQELLDCSSSPRDMMGRCKTMCEHLGWSEDENKPCNRLDSLRDSCKKWYEIDGWRVS